MASYPPPVPPVPPPGYDPREQARAQRAAWRAHRDQIRYQMRSMRRSSVVGPLLLIAIGLIFLLMQTGRLDRGHFWAWYGHWWPLVLVCAGLVVLAEWALDQRVQQDPQRPAYRRSIGGAVFVLILLCCVGMIDSHFLGHPDVSRMFAGWHIDQNSFDQLFGDKHESDAALDLSYAQGDSIVVSNPRGSITVSGTSDDNQMHLAIHKQIYAHSDSDASSKASQFNPNNKYRNSVWTVTMPQLDGAIADLVLTVPPSTPVTVTANHGDVRIASINAPVAVTANHGDVDLSAITGAAVAHINNGGSSISAHSIDGSLAIQGRAEDVTLSDIKGQVNVSGEYFGTTHVEHVDGPFHFHTSRTDFQLARLDGEVEISPDMNLSADQAMGPVTLTTRDRNITLDRLAGDVSVTNRDGSIDLVAAPALGSITLEDRDGSVQLTLPQNASFYLQANTTDGSIDSGDYLRTDELQTPAVRFTSSESGSGRGLTGSVGSGGPLVHITTTNGDISVRKGDIAPLPALPPPPPKITLTPPGAPRPPAAPRAAKAPKATPAPANP